MKNISLVFLFLLSFIPIILIGYYFYKKDTVKEPKLLLGILFISGIISCVVVAGLSILFIKYFPIISKLNKVNNYLLLALYSYIFVSLIEEICKLIMIYGFSYNNKEFDQAYDIIVYSIFVGLGFAFFENIIYIIGNPNIKTVLLRGITAVPAHVCFQTMMGYYLSLSKTKHKGTNILLSLLIPVFLHGTYDFLIFTGSTNLLTIDLGFLAIIFIICNLNIKKLIKIDKDNLIKKQ